MSNVLLATYKMMTRFMQVCVYVCLYLDGGVLCCAKIAKLQVNLISVLFTLQSVWSRGETNVHINVMKFGWLKDNEIYF